MHLYISIIGTRIKLIGIFIFFYRNNCIVNDLHVLATGVWDYIVKLRDTVSNLENRVQKAQGNIKVMDGILVSWVLKPIFERKDGKKDTLLNLEDRGERLKKVYVILELLR